MRAGQLDRLVTIQRRTMTLDSLGQPPLDYDDIATVWASVQPVTAKEARQTDQFVNLMDVLVLIRWRKDILPIDRIKLPDGRIAHVTSVVDTKFADEQIELHCMYVAEQVNSGEG